MNKKWKKIILIVIRIALAIVFIYAAIPKIIDPTQFAQDIDNYKILPYFAVTILAIILPWLELLVGLFLIVGIWLPAAAFITAALNIVFIIAIASAMYRGLDIDCGCFSTGDSLVGWKRLFEDFFLLIASVYILKETLPENEVATTK